MDSTAAFNCGGYAFESLLVGYLAQGSVHWRGPVGYSVR